jgi:hypothetical protein
MAKLFITWFAVVPVAAHLLSKAPETVRFPQKCDWTIELGPAIVAPDSSTITPPAQHRNSAHAESHCTFFEFLVGLPFSWQVLWVASFLFFIAFVIYVVACPSFIKRYPDYSAYLAHGHSIRWIVHEFFHMSTTDEVRNSVEKRLITKGYAIVTGDPCTVAPIVTADSTYVIFEHDQQNYCFGSPTENANAGQGLWEREAFWEVFEGWTKSRPLFASTVRWLVLIAGLLTLYIVFENIWSALSYIARTI